jgi:hypothetical protein
MPRTPRRFPRPLLVALVLAGVAAAVARSMAADTAGPAAAMARANRDLKVAGSAAGRVLVSAWDGSEQLFMREADAGPYSALLVPCASVVANLPAWFRLTDDAVLTSCLEIRGESGTVQVLNYRTAVGIPALWDAFYEPLASAAHLDYVGGSASGPGGETPPGAALARLHGRRAGRRQQHAVHRRVQLGWPHFGGDYAAPRPAVITGDNRRSRRAVALPSTQCYRMCRRDADGKDLPRRHGGHGGRKNCAPCAPKLFSPCSPCLP